MPYASLHEAFKTFGECCPTGAISPPFSIETNSMDSSSPELAENYLNRLETSPPQNCRQRGGNRISAQQQQQRLQQQYQQSQTPNPNPTINFDSSAQFSNLNQFNTGVVDYGQLNTMQTNVIQDDNQLDAIAKTRQRDIDIAWQVPRNQSLTRSPDDGVTSFSDAPFLLPPYMTNRRQPQNQNQIGGNTTGIVPGDCSDDTCLILINHMLKCHNCMQKFKRLLNLNKKDDESSFLSFLPNTNTVTPSKVVFFVVVIIIIIALYELLRTIFRKLG